MEVTAISTETVSLVLVRSGSLDRIVKLNFLVLQISVKGCVRMGQIVAMLLLMPTLIVILAVV